MLSQSYQDWTSLYTQDIGAIWEQENQELRKIAMIYCAFQNELNRLKDNLHEDLEQVRAEYKKKQFLEKCKNFKGLAFSEKFDDIKFSEKENETPELLPLKEHNLNEIDTEVAFIESPNTAAFDQRRTPSPQCDKTFKDNSPILRKTSFKNKKKTSPPQISLKLKETPAINTPEAGASKVPFNDSNFLDCSIIEESPAFKLGKRSKRSTLQVKKKKPKLNKSKQGTTLTQMFFEPQKFTKSINSNAPSLTVSEMLKFINESGSESDAQSDVTVDLEIPNDSTFKSPEKKKEEVKKPQEIGYEEVVRGKERLKLKGWSCNDCMDYFEGLGLPPDELQKKKDLCSRHRFKFKPRDETYEGFWDLSFKPTPPSQESQSVMLNYKKN